MSKVSVSLIFAVVIVVVTAYDGKSRIVKRENEVDVKGVEFPFISVLRTVQVIEGQKTVGRCVASIIREDAVLTPAHCVIDTSIEDLKIYAGNVHKKRSKHNTQVRTARQYITHENYNSSSDPKLNDIAIVFLTEPFKITQFVGKIELPTETDYILSSNPVAIGSRAHQKGQNPNAMKATEMVLIPNKDCQSLANATNARFSTNNKQEVTDDMVCTIDKYQSTTCRGDPGSPLVYNNKLIGITTWAFDTNLSPTTDKQLCNTNFPAVFSKIVNYVDWIKSKLQ